MDERDERAQEQPEDLEVPEEETDQVKGGSYMKYYGVDGEFKAPNNSGISARPGGGSS